MESFLKKKWIGPIVLLLYSLGLALFISGQITPYLRKAVPIINQEASVFLPITIQNGEIVQPSNKLIQRTYTIEDETFNLVLDTRTDTLDINTLPGEGLYISKKCSYFVSSNERKMECFDSAQTSEALTITKDNIESILSIVDKYSGIYLTVFLFIIFFVFFYIAILLYTVIMHWFIALLFKTSFWQTLYINTLAYVLWDLFEECTHTNWGILVKIVLFAGVNAMICRSTKEKNLQ